MRRNQINLIIIVGYDYGIAKCFAFRCMDPFRWLHFYSEVRDDTRLGEERRHSEIVNFNLRTRSANRFYELGLGDPQCMVTYKVKCVSIWIFTAERKLGVWIAGNFKMFWRRIGLSLIEKRNCNEISEKESFKHVKKVILILKNVSINCEWNCSSSSSSS